LFSSEVTKLYMATTVREEAVETTDQPQSQEIDSKYRLIILAAKRSKQLQRGARPRIDIDPTKHKPTRIALEEVIQGTVPFHFKIDGDESPEST
jgi:DNA-directed RNA polymerase subunit omega